MNVDKFWSIIDQNLKIDIVPDARLNSLREALDKLSPNDLISFDITFRLHLNSAYKWDMWGAAYVIHGGCSDDGFEYFRRWLVSRGRTAFEAALADADSLALLTLEPTGPDGVWEFEDYYYTAMDVYEEKGGEGDVRDHSEPEAGLDGVAPAGVPFAENEEHLTARYPKLWKRFRVAET